MRPSCLSLLSARFKYVQYQAIALGNFLMLKFFKCSVSQSFKYWPKVNNIVFGVHILTLRIKVSLEESYQFQNILTKIPFFFLKQIVYICSSVSNYHLSIASDLHFSTVAVQKLLLSEQMPRLWYSFDALKGNVLIKYRWWGIGNKEVNMML